MKLMKHMTPMRMFAFISMLMLAQVAALPAQSALATGGDVPPQQAVQEIQTLMDQWIDAVALKHSDNLAALIDSESKDHYLRIKALALTGDLSRPEGIGETEQLQVMFFRLMIDEDRLAKMTAPELIAFAVEKGFIGMELRRGDVLKDIQISNDTAVGRLYKFGLDDRPDPYRQYFIKEGGAWRIRLQGEWERLDGEFDQFVSRSGLSRSEAAFFILETRLMRKVESSDFYAAQAVASKANPVRRDIAATPAVETSQPRERYRVVAIRLPQSGSGKSAITLDDLHTGLKHILHLGDEMPGYPDIRLHEIGKQSAAFRASGKPSTTWSLAIDSDDYLSRRSPRGESPDDLGKTLIDEAILGDAYKGQMMLQWRNVGLRGRPQLLQQGWLTPEYGGATGPDKVMLGLKARSITPSSFWDQAGVQTGDVLAEINGLPVNSMNAWQKLMEIAQARQELMIKVVRDGDELVFHTRTVVPR